MKYPKLISWLLRLSETDSFKKEMDEFFCHHDRLDQGRKNYNTGELILLEHTKDSPGLTEVKYSFDNQIYHTTFNSNSKIATNVLKPIFDNKQEPILIQWRSDIKLALQLTDTNSFYLNFPNYLKSLELTYNNIESLIVRVELQNKHVRGNPNWKGLSSADKATIIRHAQKLIKSDPEEYKPKKGALVSERLKDQVTDDLKHKIKRISRHKVARILHKYYTKTS